MKRIFALLILIPATALVAQIVLSGGARVSTVASAPPPAGLAISTPNCGSGITGIAYTCTLAATGGTAPYTWSVLSGSLPTGLSLSSAGVISGTPSATGSFTSSVQVVDSASPHATASTTIVISIIAPGTCGFPTYGCGRSDWATFIVNSMTSVPPDAGSNHCVAGADGRTDTNGTVIKAGLQTCGNNLGKNTIITDPQFGPNVRILRLTDATSKCEGSAGTGVPNISGSAQANNFDPDSQYFVATCRTSRIFWFDPVTMQLHINPPNNPTGVVTDVAGEMWTSPNGCNLKATYTILATFVCFTRGLVTLYHITNGVMDGNWSCPSASADCTQLAPITPPIADLASAVPCWNPNTIDAQLQDCPDWQASHTYAQGSNLFPTLNNTTGYCTGANTGSAQGTGSCAHSYQLVSQGSCTSGVVSPDWNSINYVFSGGQYLVLTDGTCRWADMSVPLRTTNGFFGWGAGWSTDLTDDIFHQAASNDRGGQDGRGACYVMVYKQSVKTYYHINTCTGNAYTTVCINGTDYQCAGGTWSRTYLGNAIYANSPPVLRACGTACDDPNGTRLFAANMHALNMMKNGKWTDGALGGNNCALADAVTHLSVMCARAANKGTAVNEPFWNIGTTQMMDSWTWIGAGAVGHGTSGYNQFVFRNNPVTDPNLWSYRSLDMVTTSVSPLTPPNQGVIWNVSCPPGASPLPTQPNTACPGILPNNCSPNSCWVNSNTTISFDDHVSSVSVDTTDRTPVCATPYPTGAGNSPSTLWPRLFPWLGEVVCFALDGSNHVTRHGFVWNSGGSTLFNPQFWIGQLSTDGNWWIMTADWWCTLGAAPTAATGGLVPNNICGLPYQQNHNYATIGERWGQLFLQSGNAPGQGQIFEVTTPGTTDNGSMGYCGANGARPAPACICATTGCIVTAGTATFTNVGPYNARIDLFLFKLQ